jgi:hypothetical protein
LLRDRRFPGAITFETTYGSIMELPLHPSVFTISAARDGNTLGVPEDLQRDKDADISIG